MKFSFNWNKYKKKYQQHDEERRLLEQYFALLNSNYLKILHENQNVDKFKDLTAKIDDLFNEQKSWKSAFYIEQLMVPMLSEEYLDAHLKRRFVELKNHLDPDTRKYFESAAKEQKLKGKQAILEQIITDLHWQHEIRKIKRRYVDLARKRTDIVFVLSVLAFLIPTIIFALFDLSPKSNVVLHLLVVITSGALGAAFSMLINLTIRLEKSVLDNLRVLNKFGFIFSRAIVGIGAALILYYFIEAGFLTGPLLPTIHNELSTKGVDANFAKLIVWCFLAGFSEKLIPNILSSTEGKAVKSMQQKSTNIQ